MNDEFIKLNNKQVRFVKALNEVHKSKNFHPWRIKGKKDFYLHKEFQIQEGIPADFKEFFNTLEGKKIQDAEIEMVNWNEFDSYEDFEIRAAANPYDFRSLPPNLYHYTDANGLFSIINSQKLWATHYAFLNDYNEFEYAKHLFKRIILETLGDSPEQIEVKTNWKHFENQFQSFNIFLVSFSTEKDLLSQWRGYANHGKGYSLGFQTDIIGLTIPPKKRTQTFLVRPVLYEIETQEKHILKIVEKTLEKTEKKAKTFNSPYHYSLEFYHSLHLNGFMQIVTYKSPSFKEENEWRAIHIQTIFDNLYPDNFEIKFRSTSEHIIPYIELDLNSEVGDESERFPLNEIVYGPTLNEELAERSLKLFMKKTVKKKKKINITKSELTLR